MDLTRYTESTMTSYKDPVSGQTIYGNNGSAAVPEGGFQAAIGGTPVPHLWRRRCPRPSPAR